MDIAPKLLFTVKTARIEKNDANLIIPSFIESSSAHSSQNKKLFVGKYCYANNKSTAFHFTKFFNNDKYR